MGGIGDAIASTTNSMGALGGGIFQGIGAEEAGRQNISGQEAGLAELRAAREAAKPIYEQGQAGLSGAQASYDPYVEGGLQSYQQQQALSGALGAEAQQAAYDQFVESPGVAFQREQGESAINRQASATGGFGGASRLKAMSQFNQGLAEQSINQRFSQLGTITGLGQQGLAAQSNLAGQQANLGSQFNALNQGYAGALAGQQGAIGAAQAARTQAIYGAIGGTFENVNIAAGQGAQGVGSMFDSFGFGAGGR